MLCEMLPRRVVDTCISKAIVEPVKQTDLGPLEEVICTVRYEGEWLFCGKELGWHKGDKWP